MPSPLRGFCLKQGIMTLEGPIKLVKALHVSLDELVFDEHEREPSGKMKLLFEAVERLGEPEQPIIHIQELLEGMLVKYEARW